MSEISVLGIDAANLLSITHWAFSELEISMSFSLAVAITALPPHCQKTARMRHSIGTTDLKNTVYIIISLRVLCPFSLHLPHAIPAVITCGKLQNLKVLLMDLYWGMYKSHSWICTYLLLRAEHWERVFTDSGKNRVLDITFCKHL